MEPANRRVARRTGASIMNQSVVNIDENEREKFDRIASSWWDPEGESRPLHEINPARVRFVRERATLPGSSVADIGCGGGLLAEALAREGAKVTGVDIAERALAVARLHALEAGVDVDYEAATVEDFGDRHARSFDLVTCMEMLEHVPDPASVVAGCAKLLRPGGEAFFSTLNRTPRAFALAIVGAEYIAGLVPRGTHRYDRFIKPSELLGWARSAGLKPLEVCGLHYEPFTRTTRLGGSVAVNYLVHVRKPREPG